MLPGYCGELWDFFFFFIKRVNVPVHLKDSAIDIALKMADSRISAVTTELGTPR